MKNKFLKIFFPAIVMTSCNSVIPSLPNLDIQKVIHSADVHRNVCLNAETVPLYQGNGRWGCCYGALGLHDRPDVSNKYGKTQWMHLQHYVRAKFNADYLLPLAKIYWDKTPDHINNYFQHQSFYDGIVCTQFESGENKLKTTTWFDPVDRDVAGIKIELDGTASDIILDPFREMVIHYDQKLAQSSKISNQSDVWRIDITIEDKTSTLYVKTNAKVQNENNTLRISLHQGENNILISFNQPVTTSIAGSLEQTKRWWHETWSTSGLLVIPDTVAQTMWVRSMAQILSTFRDGDLGIPPPCGLSGNAWPFNFPGDSEFSHPVLLFTGNINVAKSRVEYWANAIDGLKSYTKKLFHTNVEGIACPHVYPYGDFQGFLDPEPPNRFYYDHFGSGFLAKMAHQTAIFVNDDVWSNQYALPLIRETAEFYKSICTKRDDGLWDIFVFPSSGMDENGGMNQKNYLCDSYAAQYCFQLAIEYGLDRDGIYRQLVNNLAFPILLSPKGVYYTCEGSGEEDYGKQKHPPQLIPLAFLPVDAIMSEPSRKAYELRYEITSGAKEPNFAGWTLQKFLLAGSRYGNIQEWLKDWNNLPKAGLVDPEWIQEYESSKAYSSSYYISSTGLIAQSLINNLICDWYGKLEIAKCNPWTGKVFVKNIHSGLGVIIDGTIEWKSADLYLTAWKDTEFEINDKTIKLRKGEKSNFKMP